ncbi:cell envelope integrity protein TolA [Aliikangiella sp. IMCC44359]|uniref:cell envelope integrity protein TolA n=1 Tax=Aliikangiella sp. IMCC44359 TaxID=3459125 RepID=UPI00403B1530
MKLKVAIFLSVLAHIGLIALLLSNFQFSKVELKQSGAPKPQINAKAVNSKRVEQLVEKLRKERLDKRKSEKQRLEQLKNAEKEAARKRKEEERKAEDARKKRKKAEEQRKLEEKKTADLKKKRIAEEKQRKKKAEAEKKRKAEAERKRKADAERKRKEEAERKRKAKEEAERKRKAAEEKARQEALEREMQAQMDAEAAELEAAHQQQVMSEVDKYAKLIEGRVRRNWIISSKGHCKFKLKLSPGGLVLSVSVVEGSSQHCVSGERAIYKSEPLPVSKDPDVFEVLKSINLTLDNRNDESNE